MRSACIHLAVLIFYLFNDPGAHPSEAILRSNLRERGSYEYDEWRIFKVTAYVPCRSECDDDPLVAALGDRVFVGMLAVDPDVIPLGSRLLVSGYNGGQNCYALDTGSKVKGRHIDCLFWYPCPQHKRSPISDCPDCIQRSRREAMRWGVRRILIHVQRDWRIP